MKIFFSKYGQILKKWKISVFCFDFCTDINKNKIETFYTVTSTTK